MVLSGHIFYVFRKFRGNLCQDLCKPFLIATFSRSNSLFILISPPAKRHRFFGAFFAGGETGAKPSYTLHNGFARAQKNINLRNCFLRASFCHQTKLLLIFSDLNTLAFHGDRLIASTSGKRNTHDFVRIFVLLKHEYLYLYRNCFRNQASKASK